MEQLTRNSFILFMLLTASMVVGGIWFGELMPEMYFQATATSFIIGLASFLGWATVMTYRFLEKI